MRSRGTDQVLKESLQVGLELHGNEWIKFDHGCNGPSGDVFLLGREEYFCGREIVEELNFCIALTNVHDRLFKSRQRRSSSTSNG